MSSLNSIRYSGQSSPSRQAGLALGFLGASESKTGGRIEEAQGWRSLSLASWACTVQLDRSISAGVPRVVACHVVPSLALIARRAAAKQY